MSFFGGLSGLFSGGSNGLDEAWNTISSPAEVDELLARTDRPQLVYKHSFICSISVFAKSNLESGLDELAEHADLHFIDVRGARDCSLYFADKVGIRHESPQLIIVENGKAVFHTSHGGVQLRNALQAVTP
ncbi:MAG: bacillithiol system redox-active protein YtxJ [Balneolaceae bacterium]